MCDTDFFETGEKLTNLEPTATNLAIQIQDGIDIRANKNRLAQLLLPFISKIVGYSISSFYDRENFDDAVQQFILKHILDNNARRMEIMYLYKFDRTYNVPFCKYLRGQLHYYCMNWERDYNEAKHRGPSLDDDSDIAEGKNGSPYEFEASKNKYEQEEELRDIYEILPLIASAYLIFFNAVNNLDKDKTIGQPFHDGERIVNEQKLLAYHIRFINSEFEIFQKFKSYDINRVRALSYMKANRINDNALKQTFNVAMEYMKILEERIVERNLADAVFLPPEKNIHNTVDEWLRAPRMTDRIERERVKLVAAIESFGKDYNDGIK